MLFFVFYYNLWADWGLGGLLLGPRPGSPSLSVICPNTFCLKGFYGLF